MNYCKMEKIITTVRKGGDTMKDSIDEALNSMLGKRSNFTLEEILAAQKQKKLSGGNLLDTLQQMTGRKLPDLGALVDQQSELQNLCAEAEAQMNELEQQLGTSAATLSKQVAASAGTEVKKVGLESFDGLAEELAQQVCGEDAFLKKLVVAFKRPFVMPPKSGYPRNAIFLTGGDATGKHLSLTAAVAALKKRGVLSNGTIRFVDLSLYPSAGEEKLFLQDLYSALKSPAEVLAFEHFEQCHPSFLTQLSALVREGKCALSARYTMQNGQLISVSNSLASDAVGSFSAAGKYLVFISELSLEKLADSFGAPFINALGDVAETVPLTKDALTQIAQRKQAELAEVAGAQLSFHLTSDETLTALAVSHSDKQRGLRGVLDFYDDLIRALAEAQLSGSYGKDLPVQLTVENERVFADFGLGPVDCLAMLPTGYSGEIEEIRVEMDEIVGLKEVKEYILSLEEYYSVQKKRREQGLKASEVSKHMIFTGNPGTGKTTIARIISRYLKAIGVLSGGQLIEVSRADLVGRYVGHTAPLTNQVISSAIGGVLFIDEAYSLYRGKDDSFGLEAIDTLVKGIEDNRDDLIVILAGYSREMAEFLTSNSGLKSRFPNIIEFPDYTGAELLAIAESIAKSKGYRIDEDCEASLLTYFNAVQLVRAADAGNGRLARNKVEEAILNQSRRLVAEPDADLSLLIGGDFDLNDVNG